MSNNWNENTNKTGKEQVCFTNKQNLADENVFTTNENLVDENVFTNNKDLEEDNNLDIISDPEVEGEIPFYKNPDFWAKVCKIVFYCLFIIAIAFIFFLIWLWKIGLSAIDDY